MNYFVVREIFFCYENILFLSLGNGNILLLAERYEKCLGLQMGGIRADVKWLKSPFI